MNAEKVLAGLATEVVIHPRVALALLDLIQDAEGEEVFEEVGGTDTSDLEEEIEDLRGEIKDLRAELRDRDSEIDALEDEVGELTRQIEAGDSF
jgi:peptidoglycan hydrolase CwlO-like protein